VGFLDPLALRVWFQPELPVQGTPGAVVGPPSKNKGTAKGVNHKAAAIPWDQELPLRRSFELLLVGSTKLFSYREAAD
jgi:hypothetical protein